MHRVEHLAAGLDVNALRGERDRRDDGVARRRCDVGCECGPGGPGGRIYGDIYPTGTGDGGVDEIRVQPGVGCGDGGPHSGSCGNGFDTSHGCCGGGGQGKATAGLGEVGRGVPS